MICPNCGSGDFVYMWSIGSAHLSHCSGCGLVHGDWRGEEIHQAAAATQKDWDEIRGLVSARLAHGDALVVREGAATRAFASTTGRPRIVDLEGLSHLPAGTRFPTVLVLSTVAAVDDPVATLCALGERLTSGGLLIVSLRTIEGNGSGRIGRHAHEWRTPARWHFTRQTLTLALLRAGFGRIWIRSNGAGRMTASAEMAPPRKVPRLSVIVPVFNEARTCATLLDRVFAKELPGLEKEVVVVESNSTDGTRAIVEGYRDAPGARLLFEDRPRGKGHAVRAGLAQATGDIVLIQDGDLEYDIDDYELLLKPLLEWEALFVLGSRHSGDWKMRVFNDAPLAAAVFNLGHLFYTWLVNTALRTEMTDPFTMFKVFRRDCLYGLAFEGRRFDFDFELVMKLVRKGFIPRELPVNYNARSFTEGKKVSFFRDGLSWVGVVLKHHVGSLGPADTDRF